MWTEDGEKIESNGKICYSESEWRCLASTHIVNGKKRKGRGELRKKPERDGAI